MLDAHCVALELHNITARRNGRDILLITTEDDDRYGITECILCDLRNRYTMIFFKLFEKLRFKLPPISILGINCS